MFIGREAELQFLENRYHAKGGQLVVLYGRRRVGKTETLKQFCHRKPHVFFFLSGMHRPEAAAQFF